MKYGNKKTEVDGIVFDSKKEAARYQELKLLYRAGTITRPLIHPRWDLIVNGKKICTYIADFMYYENSKLIVEDVKGMRTPVYRLKKKLMLAVHGLTITEV